MVGILRTLIEVFIFTKNFGCDWKLHSNLTVDYCGVCGGNNSTCSILSGQIKISTFKIGGLN